MAPEVMNLEKYDARVDMFSFGVILFELLFGYHPFKAVLSCGLSFSNTFATKLINVD